MNKIIPVIAIVFAFTLGTVFSADIATAVKPVTEVFVTNTEPIVVTGSLTSNPVCPAENIQHWNGIEFFTLQTISGDNLPDLRPFNSYQIVVEANPNDIIDAIALVVEKLNADGYTDQGFPFTTDSIPAGIDGVSYSTICAEN